MVRCDKWACWSMYEVMERKLEKGGSSPLASGGRVTRLWQKSLLAWVKSYVARRTAASLPGLFLLVLVSSQPSPDG